MFIGITWPQGGGHGLPEPVPDKVTNLLMYMTNSMFIGITLPGLTGHGLGGEDDDDDSYPVHPVYPNLYPRT